MTPSELWYSAAGSPVIPYDIIHYVSGHCATCAAPITTGVAIKHVVGPAFSSHADYFRGYSKYICLACAWLYGYPKQAHRNLIGVPGRLWWPMIGYESATEDRPQWLRVLCALAGYPPETPVAGVLTTDPKPRFWPRAELCTVGDFGLYVHAPDYDVSEFRRFDLAICLHAATICLEAITAGWPKKMVVRGLYHDFKRVSKNPMQAAQIETALQPLRRNPAFIPAVLISGIKKDDRVATSTNTGTTQGGGGLTNGTQCLQHAGRNRAISGSLPLFDSD